MLEIKLLGQFDVRLDDKPVEILSRPTQSLFAYLLVKRTTAHRREMLAGLFWPNATETNARAYLRQALWRIRRALEASHHDYFLADDLTVAFDTHSDFKLDVAELERAVTANNSVDELLACVSVYQGELVPGFYDDWVMPERERLQSLFETKINFLIDRLIAERRWSDVLQWGERWIALGTVPELAFRALMIAHSALGDRSSMAAVYERCTKTLRDQLDVEPSESTRALYEKLSKGDVPSAPVPERKLSSAPLTNLPRQLTSFIGREREMLQVKQLLKTARLVTLIGTGGSGKTRLAVQVAQDLLSNYPQGVWLVELAPLADACCLAQVVAAALDVREEQGRPVLATLVDYLRTRKCLLILDNCEHLIEASAGLAESLLRACPDLQILASSREALGIAGETVFRVPSLSIPDPRHLSRAEALLDHDAVRLFVDRTASVLPGFAVTGDNASAIAQLTFRLDGIPLAIELAAARAQVLTVEQIAARLTDTFRLLSGGSRTALPRQQTLQATMDWSYNLLSDSERILLRRLSVFAGGWILEAAEQVCSDKEQPAVSEILNVLSSLVAKSLVVAEPQGTAMRYRMLETIRVYAREKLFASGEGESIRNQHLNYFRMLAEHAELELRGPHQLACLNRIEGEIDNIRAALDWSLETDVEPGLRLAGALIGFCLVRGHITDILDKLLQLLNHPNALPRTEARAKALDSAASLFGWGIDLDHARVLVEESLSIYRELGNKRGEASALHTLSDIVCLQDDYTLGQPLALKSLELYRSLGDQAGIANVLIDLGSLIDNKNYPRARDYLEQAMVICRERGDTLGISWALDGLGVIAMRQGEFQHARIYFEESLAIQTPLRGPGAAFAVSHLGDLALREGDYARAVEFYQQSISMSDEAGQVITRYWDIVNLGYVALQKGDHEQARATFQEAQKFFHDAGSKIGVVYALEGLASLAARQTKPARALRLFGWADAMRAGIGDLRPPVEQVGVDHDLTPIRVQLDPNMFEAAYAEGRAMTMEQAIAYAIAEEDKD
ncbi:MAG: tetratricopeptide repeat protein [Chloroflexi bacterium]|nr:tetratricopeptide repeat protein [Chloroflexota bacterium]